MAIPITAGVSGLARSGDAKSGYPILTGVVVEKYALSGIARSNAFRSGYHSPHVFIAIGGIHYGTGRGPLERVLVDSLTVTDVIDETPNRASFVTMGLAPTVGQNVVLTLGSKNNNARLFAGQILNVEQAYVGDLPVHAQYRCDCIDNTWGLDKRLVSARYAGVSATAIAVDLVTTYAPGYTTTFIAPGLELVDEITFTNETLTDALTRIAKRIGGYWYCDYVKAVHLFSGAEDVDFAGLTNPTDLTTVHPSLANVQSTRDLSQVVTRVRSEGGGGTALETIAPGETVLPVSTGEWYAATGGQVRSGPQHVSYSGRELGGGGTLVGPGARPSVAPTVTRVSGAGIDAGVHSYAVTFVTASGESLSGPAVAVTAGALAAPGTPTVGAPTIGTGPNPGTHLYAVTFVTAVGETTPGATIAATTTVTPPPAIAPTPGTATIGTGPDPGTHEYAVTFLTSIGETTPSVISASGYTGLTPAPTSAPTLGLASGGSVNAGTHHYTVTFVTAIGETISGPGSAPITTGGPAASGPTTAPTPQVAAGGGVTVGSHTYAVTFTTAAGETAPGPISSPVTPVGALTQPTFPLLTQYNHAAATQLGPGQYHYKISFVTATGETTAGPSNGISIAPVIDPAGAMGVATTTGGSVPPGAWYYVVSYLTAAGETGAGAWSGPAYVGGVGGSNPATNAVDLTSVPLSPDPRVTGRKIYRTAGQLFEAVHIGTLADNATTSFRDSAATGGAAPPSNSTYYAQVQLTAIPTGPAGVTARRIYRTDADGVVFYLLATIANNTATTYIDQIRNITTNPSEPPTNTTQMMAVSLSAIPTGPSGTQSRKVYRTTAGGAVHYFLVELGGNSTTSYLDTVPDSALGGAVMPSAGATLNTITLTQIPTGDANVISRRLYRTAAWGATYHLLTTIADNSTRSYTDTAADASLGAATPTVNSAYLQRIRLTAIQKGDANVIARNIYRRSGGLGLKFAGTVADNTTTSWTDTVPNASLGGAPPATNGAHLQQFPLSKIPLGPATVVARKVYRTPANSGVLLLAATLADNTTTAWTDTLTDAQLGAAAPGVNGALEQRVQLSSIPIGPGGVTTRKLYRTAADQSALKLLATLADNTTTDYLDVLADSVLGGPVPVIDLSGLPQPDGTVTPGSTTLIVAGTGWAHSTGGWAIIGNGAQVIRYTGITATSLTGIPPTGVGAIIASISYNSTITAAPLLTGIPASGPGAIRYQIVKGDDVNLVVVVDDLAAQAALAALIGGDGVQETPLSDNRISENEARARADALLALRGTTEIAISYSVRDINTRAGRTVKVNLGPPTNLLGAFTLQQVTMTPTTPAATTMPTYLAQASTTRFSFENLLALARKAAG